MASEWMSVLYFSLETGMYIMLLVVPLLIAVAYLTLAERRVIVQLCQDIADK